MSDEDCIHGMTIGSCSICKGLTHGPDPKNVGAGIKAAASRAGRVALPPTRFVEEIDAAVKQLKDAGEPVNVSAVQRTLRAAGYESGRRPTTAVMSERGYLQ